MEQNLFNDEFEQFLKQKADQYKIHPSNNVWKNIYHVLHTKRRGYIIGSSLLLLLSAFLISKELSQNVPSTSNNFPVNNYTAQNTPLSSRIKLNAFSFNKTSNINQFQFPALTFAATSEQQQTGSKKNAFTAQPAAGRSENIVMYPSELVTDAGIQMPVSAAPDNEPALQNDLTIKKEAATKLTEATKKQIAADNYENTLSMRYAERRRSSRVSLQLYASPTIGFRTLLDDGVKGPSRSGIPSAVTHLDVNRFVNHKPAMGLEAGAGFLFALNKSLSIKSGLQMNFTRYGLQAYPYSRELATIALNPVGDTLTSYTSLRNIGNGLKSQELQNKYLQLAVPIGAELRVLGDGRLQLNVAGTIQPSLLLSHTTYLLSSDYVHYTQEPSLVRKWNVATSLETYISYYSNGVRWQVGPQFRYQLLSTYKNSYPVKENLMEYGIKIGISRPFR